MGENGTCFGFDDVYFTPLPVENLGEQIIDIVFSDFKGIIHLGSDEKISKYEFFDNF